MSRWPTAIAVLMLCAVLFAAVGCGGGKTSATPTAESTTAVKAARSKAQCLQYAQAEADAATVLSTALSGEIFSTDPLGDAPAFRGSDMLPDTRKFAARTATVPDEVKSDFETINDAFVKLGQAVGRITVDVNVGPTPSAKARLKAFQDSVDQSKLRNAETAASTWLTRSCPYY